ncbi:MAG: helix-turn-helix transcriptional regulator [Catenulispora sp.]|nr:helix-turn-helix transcriptional regulator [Catenulispora sp.]
MGLASEVRRLRLARGLTQRELAEPAYTRAFVAAIESGARVPSDEALAHLAGRLGTGIDDLRNGRPPGTGEQLRSRLADARLALSHGKAEESAAELKAVLEQAQAYQLTEIVGWARLRLGEIHTHLGEVDRALEVFEGVLAQTPPELVRLHAAAVARVAYTRFTVGDPQRAMAVLETELRALRDRPEADADAELRVASSLMYVYNELDWNDRARRVEQETAPLIPRVADQEWVAQFCSTAAQLRRIESELDDVDRLLSEAVRRYTALGMQREIGMCHWARGYVLRRAARLPEAESEFRRARAILHAVGAVQDEAGATLELAEVLRRQGALDEAGTLAAEAARTSEHTGHREGMAEASRLLGLVCGQTGRNAEAEHHLAVAADRYEGAGLMAELVTTCGLLADLLLATGREAEARAMLRRGLRGAETLW